MLSVTYVCVALLGSPLPVSSLTEKYAPDLVDNLVEISEKIEGGQVVDERAGDKLIDLAEKQPHNVNIHFLLGRFYERQKFIVLAAEEYESCIKLDSHFLPAVLGLSRLFLKTNRIAAAEDIINGALKNFPSNYYVLLLAGVIQQKQQNFQAADEYYQLAERLKPGNIDVMSQRAQILLELGDYVRAVGYADRALRLSLVFRRPEWGYRAMLVRGRCVMHMGDYEEALLMYEKAFELNPYDEAVAGLYGKLLRWHGKTEEALLPALVVLPRHVNEAGKLAFSKATVQHLLGRSRPQGVQQSIAKAATLLRGTEWEALLYFCLGDIFDRMHKPQEAMQCYKNGLKIDANYARAYLRLGMDQEIYLKDYKNALANYGKAAELLSHDDEIALRYSALKRTLANRNNDIAWRLKDKLEYLITRKH